MPPPPPITPGQGAAAAAVMLDLNSAPLYIAQPPANVWSAPAASGHIALVSMFDVAMTPEQVSDTIPRSISVRFDTLVLVYACLLSRAVFDFWRTVCAPPSFAPELTLRLHM
jgi:hypothetical protein